MGWASPALQPAGHAPAGPCAKRPAHSDLPATIAPKAGPQHHLKSACCSTAADNRCRPSECTISGRLPSSFLGGEPLKEPRGVRPGLTQRSPAGPRPSRSRSAAACQVARPGCSPPSRACDQLAMAQVFPGPDLTSFLGSPALMARLAGVVRPGQQQPLPGFRGKIAAPAPSRSLESARRHGGRPEWHAQQARPRAQAAVAGQGPMGLGPTGQWQDRAFPAGRPPAPPCSRARRQCGASA